MILAAFASFAILVAAWFVLPSPSTLAVSDRVSAYDGLEEDEAEGAAVAA